jgi:hypothetical protein
MTSCYKKKKKEEVCEPRAKERHWNRDKCKERISLKSEKEGYII